MDRDRNRQVFPAPGRAIALDAIGSVILARVDGPGSLAAIVAALFVTHDAPVERIAEAVRRISFRGCGEARMCAKLAPRQPRSP